MQQEHTNAFESHAVARYLLDEMSEEERDSFEDHFADCRVCGDDVRDGARMMAAGRVVAREDRPRGWFTWLPAVAASIMGILIGWQATLQTIPRYAPVEVIRQVELETDQDRAATAAPEKIDAGTITVMNLFIPPRDEAASYVVTIQGPSGAVGQPFPFSRDDAADQISLGLRGLPRGSYQVVIEGVRKEGNRFPVTSVPFVVEER